MESAAAPQITRECDTFCRYLSGRSATQYIRDKYVIAQQSLPATTPDDLLDRALLSVARIGPLATRVADSYAVAFRREARLRLKLILLFAVLENSAETHAWFDESVAESRVALVLNLGWIGLTWFVSLVAGVVVFGPTHLYSQFARGTDHRG